MTLVTRARALSLSLTCTATVFGTELATTSQSRALAAIPGAKALQGRTFTGIEARLGEDEVQGVVEGRGLDANALDDFAENLLVHQETYEGDLAMAAAELSTGSKSL